MDEGSLRRSATKAAASPIIWGAPLVVDEARVVEAGAFHERRGPVGDREQLLDARPASRPLDPREALPQGFHDDPGDGLAGQARD